MIEVESRKNEVETHTRKRVNDLTSMFSMYDLINEDEREEHLQEVYVPAVTEIASNLDVLSKEDAKYKSVKEALSYLKRNKGLNTFDPRYLSSYSTKWSEKPDKESKVNQRLIDIESELKLEDIPEARFVLLNSLRYLAGKEIDVFELRVHESYERGFVDLIDELEHNFDVITLPFNLKQKKKVSTKKKKGPLLSRFTRREFEGYILKRFRKDVIGDENGYLNQFSFEHWEDRVENYEDEDYNDLEEFCNLFDGRISDESFEDFASNYKKYAIDVALFNKLFWTCKRTKEDLRIVDGNRGHFLGYIKSLYGRNVYFNFPGEEVMEDVEKMDISNDLIVFGNGYNRFNAIGEVTVGRDFVCSGRGDSIMGCGVNNLTVGRNFTRRGNGGGCLQDIRLINIGGDFDLSGDGVRLFGNDGYRSKKGVVKVGGNLICNGKWGGGLTDLHLEIQGEVILDNYGDETFLRSTLKVGDKKYSGQKKIVEHLKSKYNGSSSEMGKVKTKKLRRR